MPAYYIADFFISEYGYSTRPGHHASAPYSSVLIMHAYTARIRGLGAAPRYTLYICRKK